MLSQKYFLRNNLFFTYLIFLLNLSRKCSMNDWGCALAHQSRNCIITISPWSTSLWNLAKTCEGYSGLHSVYRLHVHTCTTSKFIVDSGRRLLDRVNNLGHILQSCFLWIGFYWQRYFIDSVFLALSVKCRSVAQVQILVHGCPFPEDAPLFESQWEETPEFCCGTQLSTMKNVLAFVYWRSEVLRSSGILASKVTWAEYPFTVCLYCRD